MSPPQSVTGLWMLAVLAALVLGTGLPVWTLLIGTASTFAGIGWCMGVIDANVLSAVSARTLGLLEHDLLQALPLYVFIGVLLQRLRVADILFSTMAWGARHTGAGTSLAAFGVAALVAPMNGSVASSSAMLARLVSPRLGQVDAATSTALVSASSTLGVVVPPSLVLILLGDAMLRAHTEASNLPGYALGTQRIVNTQDVFHAALLPALGVFTLWLGVAWWQGQRLALQPATAKPRPSQWALTALVLLMTLTLLGGIFVGQIFAVEAAATGAVVLIGTTLMTRALPWSTWHGVLDEALSLSGALLALLVGASTFSLVFRLWGTDVWITNAVLGSELPPVATAGVVLLAVALCAWVLDAFEMIFVIIPIVAPPLIAALGDAQQTAVLLLLVLQLSFLIPPMGYAVMMARLRSGQANVPMGTTLKALRPYLFAQCAVMLMVFFWPSTVHQLDAKPAPAIFEPVPSTQDIEQQMRDMADMALEKDKKP
jgi:TRAP-type mannitol/chloroaromatic compound transport system permease large subunit